MNKLSSSIHPEQLILKSGFSDLSINKLAISLSISAEESITDLCESGKVDQL